MYNHDHKSTFELDNRLSHGFIHSFTYSLIHSLLGRLDAGVRGSEAPLSPLSALAPLSALLRRDLDDPSWIIQHDHDDWPIIVLPACLPVHPSASCLSARPTMVITATEAVLLLSPRSK
eukprot:GHVU01175768.1.p1 GENE.GHVU01175768.1~~GHVU01175768.1.p1  ORF type:complete len:132 (-),score=7.31 GHVU01175768.1:196-552(-)